ncbi:hypothetical protein WA026_018042 [Henosepilachna vigintioctopunctata]|uniref:Ig-like domain-containing protein n=1 Tax=Henosepilachna vigintioctopunctata TaxID=420089 RepID=A0AAW1UPT3_9CUCU
MGPYLCIASNGVPPSVSKRIMLIVHFPPMIWIQNQLVGAMEGQQITLECYSEAYPKSINYWTKEGNMIVEDCTDGVKEEVVICTKFRFIVFKRLFDHLVLQRCRERDNYKLNE